MQARALGRAMRGKRIWFSATSGLRRANQTLQICLDEMFPERPVVSCLKINVEKD